MHTSSLLAALMTSAAAVALTSAASVTARAQGPAASHATVPPRAAANSLTVDRIFKTGEFRGSMMPTVHWLKDGVSYIDLAPSVDGANIVRVDAATGKSTILVRGSVLHDARGKRIDIEDMIVSDDERKALLFHHSERVWRRNTKGQYTVVDFTTKKVTQISPNTGPKLFAKFSPDGRQVAFVRDNDLYVVDLATGVERRLTTDGGPNIINGTTDWAYEEEFDLRDGFRWSPDGRAIAFWRFDQSRIPVMTLINQTDSLYPTLYQYKYPKAGEANSTV
jgi:dipeptidyl-peptidase-4